MASNTPNFNWYLPTIGGDSNIWGSYLNSNTTSEDTVLRAIANCNIATTAPSYLQTGTLWLNSTSNPYPLNIYDGASWVPMGSLNTSTHTFTPVGNVLSVQAFTSNGTYTPTVGMLYCIVECVGGGAGGGGAPGGSGTASAAGGGGGGGYSRSLLTAAQISTSQTASIGVGGTGGTNAIGAGGGETSLGSLVIAFGGAGGTEGTASTVVEVTGGGAGGTQGTGTIVCPGYGGGFGLVTITGGNAPGYGGNSVFGAGGISSGGNGSGYGAGGAGGTATSSGQKGGNGTPGIIYITEFS